MHHYNLDIHQFAVPRLIIGAVYKQMEEKMKVTADLKLTFHLLATVKSLKADISSTSSDKGLTLETSAF